MAFGAPRPEAQRAVSRRAAARAGLRPSIKFLQGVSTALFAAPFPSGRVAGGGSFRTPQLHQASDRGVSDVLWTSLLGRLVRHAAESLFFARF